LLIRQVAHVIRSLAREGYRARFGAGEFFLVLPETDQAGAIILSERLRDAVEARRLGAGQLPDPITISLGIFTPTEVSDIEPAALIRNADASLRQAKAQGRNQILAI
jgi:diguanylate cyclase (GGDEF)-like protein